MLRHAEKKKDLSCSHKCLSRSLDVIGSVVLPVFWLNSVAAKEQLLKY